MKGTVALVSCRLSHGKWKAGEERASIDEHQIWPSVKNDRADEGAERRNSVSRDRIIRRRQRGQGKHYFPGLADHQRDWQPYPVMFGLLYATTI